MIKSSLLVITSVFFLASHCFADKPDSSSVIVHDVNAVDLLVKKLRELKSFSAHFSQRVSDDLGKILQETEGEIASQRPNRLHWKTTTPYSSLIVIDGEWLWIYDEDLDQVTKESFSNNLASTPAMILTGDLDGFDQNFIVSKEITTDGLTQFRLIPKANAEMAFSYLDLIFMGESIQSLQLADKLGQKTIMSFSKVLNNTDLEASLFSFTPPDGVDIVENQKQP